MGFRGGKLHQEQRFCEINLKTHGCGGKLVRCSKFEDEITPHKYIGGETDY